MYMKAELKFGRANFRYGNRPFTTIFLLTRVFQKSAMISENQ